MPASCRSRANIVLLAQNEEGYRNLMRLVSHAYFGVPLGEEPRSRRRSLRSQRGTDRTDGRFHRPPRFGACARRTPGLAQARLDILKSAFGHQLYVEIQRHGLHDERLIEGELLALAERTACPSLRRTSLLLGVRRIMRRMMRCLRSRRGRSSPTTTAAGCRRSIISRRGSR